MMYRYSLASTFSGTFFATILGSVNLTVVPCRATNLLSVEEFNYE